MLTAEPRITIAELLDENGIQRVATLSIEQAGELLGIARNTANEMVRRGDLRTTLIGGRRRVTISEVFRILDLDCYGRPMRPMRESVRYRYSPAATRRSGVR